MVVLYHIMLISICMWFIHVTTNQCFIFSISYFPYSYHQSPIFKGIKWWGHCCHEVINSRIEILMKRTNFDLKILDLLEQNLNLLCVEKPSKVEYAWYIDIEPLSCKVGCVCYIACIQCCNMWITSKSSFESDM